MRNFHGDTTAALAAETAKIFWLIEIALDSATYRYTDCDIPLYSTTAILDESGDALLAEDGEAIFDEAGGVGAGLYKYEPNGFQISNIRFTADMSIDRAKIDLQNVDLIQSATILNESIANRSVKIHFGCLNAANRVIALERMYWGFVTAWGPMTVKNCPLTLGNYFMFWAKRSLRLYQATCPWAFAGGTANPECGYSGAEGWCNKTWARCSQLANTLNFGGFRWLPALEEKKIWWGMTPGGKIPGT